LPPPPVPPAVLPPALLPAAPALDAPPADPTTRMARPALVAELSQQTVDITTGFTGTQLLVFGATDRLLGPQPDGTPGDDVLVIAQNAPEPMIVRRKIEVLGFWINGPSARFRSVPGFYVVTGTRPLRDMLPDIERSTKHLGLDKLPLASTGVQDPGYREALLQLKQNAGQWREQETPMHIAGSRLFRARLDLPATVQTGDYQVQVLLVRQGRVLARQELGFRVERVGAAAQIAEVAEQQPLVYGMFCVLLAAFAGWMGSVLFRRS
ncbi:TIGR02186 family protein, partial [Teichococcus wenyumeiae]